MSEIVINIFKKKQVDIWTLKNVYTVEWYNHLRKHKLVNRKLTQKEFKLLKEWLERCPEN